jgi:hypothetical protein
MAMDPAMFGGAFPGTEEEPAADDGMAGMAEMAEAYNAAMAGGGGEGGDGRDNMMEGMAEAYGAAGAGAGEGGDGRDNMMEGMAAAYGGMAGGGGQVAPKGLDGSADFAFSQGKEKDALQYLFAHALADDEVAADLLPTIQWVPALKRPTIAVRWGVAVKLTQAKNFKGDPKPIGTTQQMGGEAGGERGGGGDYGGGEGFGGREGYAGGFEGGGGGGASNATVSKYAGEIGDVLLAAFQERVTQGKFGRVLQDASGGSGSGSGGRGGGGRGDFGAEGYGGGYAGGFEGGRGGGSAGASGGSGAESDVSMITPGLTFIGTGTDRELLEKAREEGVDLLVMLDVEVKMSPRTRLTINETRVLIVDLDPKKRGRDAQFVRTKSLNNQKVQHARKEEKDDGVDKAIEKVTKWVDENAVMIPLPEALNKSIVRKRVGGLVTAKHDDPLPILAEIKFWNRRDLLDDDIMLKAFGMLVGEEVANTLINGTAEEREAALEKWLPKKA